MIIKWYAHACLRIEGGGVSIITDPYTPHKSGFAPVDETATLLCGAPTTTLPTRTRP